MLRIPIGPFNEERSRSNTVKRIEAILQRAVRANDGERETGLGGIDAQGLPAVADLRRNNSPSTGNVVRKVSNETLSKIIAGGRIFAANTGRIVECNTATGARCAPNRVGICQVFAPSIVDLICKTMQWRYLPRLHLQRIVVRDGVVIEHLRSTKTRRDIRERRVLWLCASVCIWIAALVEVNSIVGYKRHLQGHIPRQLLLHRKVPGHGV